MTKFSFRKAPGIVEVSLEIPMGPGSLIVIMLRMFLGI